MVEIPNWRDASLSRRTPQGNPSEIDGRRILGGIALALAAYSGFSQPVPAGLGMAELAVAAGLLAAMGIVRPAKLSLGMAGPVPHGSAVGGLAFLWLLWVPLLRGTAEGHALRDILRDVVPLGFLFLPVLLGPSLAPLGARAVRWLSLGLAVAGVVFAARWMLETTFGEGGEIGRMIARSKYLLNSPAVLFAAVWLPLNALEGMRRGGLRTVPAIAGGLVGLVPLWALAVEVHRAAIGLAGLAFVGWLVLVGRRRLLPVVGMIVIAGIAVEYGNALGTVVDAFTAKTRVHGWNGRLAELRAVLDQAGASWPVLLFGTGWGGLIRNPAVGEWWVSYTHAFPSYLFLKTGLAGCFVVGAWLVGLPPVWLRLLKRDAALACALAPPLAVGLLFHTSFKYVCFGLLLTLLQASAIRGDGEDSVARDQPR